ncbi:uncharacterized protein LOC119723978 [Patiria miniata]|uniref:Uncharacterized protein n=1 Tax=Patiria miniata TaxID=46514 RepID=A0A913ZHF5_PATMI|nr:uncharacterized protein LOC119723978 [Patiria miniata]
MSAYVPKEAGVSLPVPGGTVGTEASHSAGVVSPGLEATVSSKSGDSRPPLPPGAEAESENGSLPKTERIGQEEKVPEPDSGSHEEIPEVCTQYELGSDGLSVPYEVRVPGTAALLYPRTRDLKVHLTTNPKSALFVCGLPTTIQ